MSLRRHELALIALAGNSISTNEEIRKIEELTLEYVLPSGATEYDVVTI